MVILLVNLTPVQNFIAREATKILAKKLNTTVSLRHIRIDFLNHVVLEGLYIEDQAKDTLLYAGEARVRVSDWFIFRKEVPVIRFVGLKDAYANLYRTRTSDAWNYQFVVDAFDSGPSTKPKKKTEQEFELDLKKLALSNVRFHMNDAWAGSDMRFAIGALGIDAKKIDLKKRIVDINSIEIEKAGIVLRDYEGGRPPKPKKVTADGIDTTAFNPSKWDLHLDELSLEDCLFASESGTGKPLVKEFDPEHMYISGINLQAEDLYIAGDTLKTKLKNLSAKDRSGIMIKKMKADISVSPNASICRNLYLETNNSILRDFYAMYYTRFPDFQDYVDKVVMEAHFKGASIDINDVAYFAPVLRQYPVIVKASGNIVGTVDSITGTKLNLSDGSSIVKGNLKMVGLPDINETFINYQNGELLTSGPALFKYAPALKNNKDINLAALTHAYFKGSFTGYIDNFAANGVFVTNLGTIQSDVKLNMPGMNGRQAIYSGTVSTAAFNIGTLLPGNNLGTVTLKANVEGSSFHSDIAKIKLNTTINQFEFNKYNYQNITAEGTLERKKFNGNLLINDPNLALAFYGDIDFNDSLVRIDAKANLLQSNLTALNLVKDSVSATADFDLNCVGNSVDNFTGTARLYNINVIRNNHHLDLDSIYLNSSVAANGEKVLTIESNALTANIQGNYKLTSLPASVQYYVAGYIPKYIPLPAKDAPLQDLTFNIVTKEVDSLLGIIIPNVKGFNNATVKGALNTEQQKLVLNGDIPYGEINNIKLTKVAINGGGDFNTLGLNVDAENITVGDTVVSGTVSVTTTIGNDSLLFNIATSSPDDYGTATLNGRAYAHGDSLYLTVLPSEFYLREVRWEIPAGGRAILATNYVFVENLSIKSGPQSVTINSRNRNNEESILISTQNLDISQIGNIAGIGDYQPDGRINGDIQIIDPYGDMNVSADIVATGVKFGNDTLGNVTVAGTYNAAKKIVTLDPKTGVYRGNASLTASGSMAFDTKNKQDLDGKISFNNAPVNWAAPFLVGFISNVSGTLNGTVNINGSAAQPDINGKVQLSDAGMRVDFLGTKYTIPEATVTVNNTEINLGNIKVYDQFNNIATISGKLDHDRFKKIVLGINMASSKFEVINLKENESETFYGNLIVGFQSLSIRGPVEDLAIRITRAEPKAKSHLYLPMSSEGDVGTYSYVSFVEYGVEEKAPVKKNDNKLTITIDAILNPLAELTMIMDPTTGDAVSAKGSGSITMVIPSDDDIRMNGSYVIEEGDYTFTLRQLFFKRNFTINQGSTIAFNGAISQTNLNIEAIYTTRARLYDLLNETEKESMSSEAMREEYNTMRRMQNVDLLLHMNGTLGSPKLSFNIELQDKNTAGTYAYTKLQRINQNDQELFDQVASLLLVNSFIAPEGGVGGTAASGAINNVSDILSSTASTQLTNIVNRLTGNKNLAIDLKYNTYNLGSGSADAAGINRNEVTLGLRQNLFSERLILEVGSAYDWGRPTNNSNTSNFNPVGDFRAQYLVTPNGNVRLSAFHTSNYDVLQDRNIDKNGVGISFKKTFNTLGEFFRSSRKVKLEDPFLAPTDSNNTSNRESGTW